MSEVMKHKKDLASLNMLVDEAIRIYTFSVVAPSLFGGKRIAKPEIYYLPIYGNCRDKSLQKGLGYDLEKMLNPVQ